MRTIRPTTSMLTLLLALTSCGNDGNETEATTTRVTSADDSSPPETTAVALPTTDTATDDTGAAGTAVAEPAGTLPDPCALVSNEDLAAIIGEDPGGGVVESLGPEERQICSYSEGVVIFVDHAANWQGEASFGLIQNPSVAVEGVGDEAYWQDVDGSTSQLVAVGSGYFIGVMVPSGGQPVAEQIASQVLSALGG